MHSVPGRCVIALNLRSCPSGDVHFDQGLPDFREGLAAQSLLPTKCSLLALRQQPAICLLQFASVQWSQTTCCFLVNVQALKGPVSLMAMAKTTCAPIIASAAPTIVRDEWATNWTGSALALKSPTPVAPHDFVLACLIKR